MTTSATRLFLVRHGATQLTAEDRFSGSVGVDLSDEGRRQAACLAERLAHETDRGRLLRARCARTLETAAIVGAAAPAARRSSATACARSATGAGRG